MTLFVALVFLGALACVALPEIFYDHRPPRFAPRVHRPGLTREPDLAQWITHHPEGAHDLA